MESGQGSTGFTAVRSLPWPLGLPVGVGFSSAIRNSMSWLLPQQGCPLARCLNDGVSAAIAYMLRGMCWMAAFASCVGSYKAPKLLYNRTTLASVASNGWRQFELLLGKAICHHRGDIVEETSLSRADGSLDLILLKDGRRILMQCRQWKRQQVSVSAVREMHAHSCAPQCSRTYPKEAEYLAQSKPTAMVSDVQLLNMIRKLQSSGDERASLATHIDSAFQKKSRAAPEGRSVCAVELPLLRD